MYNDIARTGWNFLQDLIQARTKKLSGAYEIHKFSRDAKEILTRIKVCMCTCVCVYMCMYAHVCVNIDVCVCACACVSTYMCPCMYACMCACACAGDFLLGRGKKMMQGYSC